MLWFSLTFWKCGEPSGKPIPRLARPEVLLDLGHTLVCFSKNLFWIRASRLLSFRPKCSSVFFRRSYLISFAVVPWLPYIIWSDVCSLYNVFLQGRVYVLWRNKPVAAPVDASPTQRSTSLCFGPKRKSCGRLKPEVLAGSPTAGNYAPLWEPAHRPFLCR